MSRLQISNAVQKELKERNLTADEVLRRALKIKTEGFTTSDGIHIPEGTVFLAWYKGRALSAVASNGNIEADGKSFSSLSAAAAHFTGRPTTNGWDFWYVKKPGEAAFVSANSIKEKDSHIA